MAGELGNEVPFHISRYFPTHKRDDPPTTEESVKNLFEIASENLDYVYTGNSYTNTGQNTFCPVCHSLVTIRSGYKISLVSIDKDGKCSCCGNQVYKNFTIF